MRREDRVHNSSGVGLMLGNMPTSIRHDGQAMALVFCFFLLPFFGFRWIFFFFLACDGCEIGIFPPSRHCTYN